MQRKGRVVGIRPSLQWLEQWSTRYFKQVTYGFLEITKCSSLSGKRLATEYPLTHLNDDRNGDPPKRTFQNIGKGPPVRAHVKGKTNGPIITYHRRLNNVIPLPML
jgi:hypothetical protein